MEKNVLEFEREAYQKGYRAIAGVDEAGRGPLAGPVVAGAVILHENIHLPGINDSKKLSEKQRNRLVPLIREAAICHAVAVVDVETIDSINILQAALLAMRQAVEQLNPAPDFLLIDGNQKTKSPIQQMTIVQGDSRSESIAAASILAKVHRDELMLEYHKRWPDYGFDRHKGYGTKDHRACVKMFGPCPIHRKTFKGVKEYLGNFSRK